MNYFSTWNGKKQIFGQNVVKITIQRTEMISIRTDIERYNYIKLNNEWKTHKSEGFTIISNISKAMKCLNINLHSFYETTYPSTSERL